MACDCINLTSLVNMLWYFKGAEKPLCHFLGWWSVHQHGCMRHETGLLLRLTYGIENWTFLEIIVFRRSEKPGD